MTLVVGNTHERGFDRLPRVRPVGRDVREVARPQHPLDADGVTVLDRVRVGDERRREALLHVLARHARELDVTQLRLRVTAVVVVALLRVVRQPAAVDLGEEHVEGREAVEHTGEDELEHAGGRVVEVHRAGQRHRRLVERRRAAQAHVDRDRLAGLRDRGPQRVVLGDDGRLVVRVALEEERDDARHRGHALHLGDRVLDADRRDERGAAEAVGRVGAHLGEVVVVDAGHGELEVAVGRVDHPVEAVGEEQLGVDAVEVERVDARLGVVATGVDVLEPAPDPLLVGRAPRARAPVERARRVAAREDPRVALVEVLHAGHLIPVLRGRVRGPQIGRVHQVAVGRDQPVVACAM